ncbi:MAG: hypothetical protein V2I63_04545, partial [Pseudomonadales bacterium]|nr:hypothetical protein [Pseudomonadales bacterium]
MTPTREHRLPPLRVATDALVPRPWGGGALRGYKGLGPDGAAGPGPFGECFEAAADPDDPEARAYASTVCTPEGTRHSLTELIAAAPDALLGAAVHARH